MSSFVLPVDAGGKIFLQAIRDCITQLGEPLTYQPNGGVGTALALSGIWGEGTDVTAKVPGALASVYLCLADLPFDPQKMDVVVHDGTSYEVMDAKVDGHGSVWLWLRSA